VDNTYKAIKRLNKTDAYL